MNKILDNIELLVPIEQSFEIVVTGYSMLPLLGYGRDTIIVRRTDATESIDNRIAMFRMPNGRITVHRVIEVRDGIVRLKGDGNLYQIEECPREKIIGVVESVKRQSGKVVSCTSRSWHRRERIWLCQPLFVRRYAIAIMRRWLNWKSKRKG
jgi:hypothetical protein